MTSGFVPYTPDIEVAEPKFDEHLKLVTDKAEDYIARSVTTEGAGGAVRDAHAKGYGVVRGEVEILDGLPDAYAQGIYASPGRHDALDPLLQRLAPRRCRRTARLVGRDGAQDVRRRRTHAARRRARHPHLRLHQHQRAGLLLQHPGALPVLPGPVPPGVHVLRPGPTRHTPLPHRLRDRKGNVRAGGLGVGRAPGHAQAAADSLGQRAAVDLLDDGRGTTRRLHRQGADRS